MSAGSLLGRLLDRVNTPLHHKKRRGEKGEEHRRKGEKKNSGRVKRKR